MNRKAFLKSIVGGIAAAFGVKHLPVVQAQPALAFHKDAFAMVAETIPYPPLSALKAGSYCFKDCFSINPATRRSTGMPLIFSVTHDGAGIWPPPIVSGPYQNCTKFPEGDPI